MNQISRHTVLRGNKGQLKVTCTCGLNDAQLVRVDGIKEVRSYEGPMLTLSGGEVFFARYGTRSHCELQGQY